MIVLMLAIFRLVGIVLILFSIIRLIKLKKIEKYGIQVEAVVVGMKENRVRTGRQVYDEYTPIQEYTFGVDEFEIGHISNQIFTDFPDSICKNKISIASSLQHRIITSQSFTKN